MTHILDNGPTKNENYISVSVVYYMSVRIYTRIFKSRLECDHLVS